MNNIDKLIKQNSSALDQGDSKHVAKLIDVIIQSGARDINEFDEVLRRIRAEVRFFNRSFLNPRIYDQTILTLSEFSLDEVSLNLFQTCYKDRWKEKAPGRVLLGRVGEVSGLFKLKRLSHSGTSYIRIYNKVD